jgi:FAD/FMN-containing dehydrogenase
MTSIADTADLAPFARPGEPEYVRATAAYQLAVTVDPVGAFVARSVADVVRAVGVACSARLPIQATTTGHAMGRGAPVSGSLLLRPEIEAPVQVDVDARTARVPAGKRWQDVVSEAAPHGLAALHGSSPTVGVIGFLLGGGLSFYGRRFGVSSNFVRSLTVVLADGQIVTASSSEHAELFWALRGGGGGFGIVVEAEIDLVPIAKIITGAIMWDAAHAMEIAPRWQRWAATAPDAVTTSLRLLNLPPVDGVPPEIADKQVLALDGAVIAATTADLGAAQEITDGLLAPLCAVATPLIDTWAVATPRELTLTHMDPQEPIPLRSDTALLREFDDEGWRTFLRAAGAGSGTTLLSVELRQLGGAFATLSQNGGVFDHIDAAYLYWSGGLMTGPFEHTTPVDLEYIRDATLSYRTGLTVPTWVERHDLPQQRTYDDETLAAVERIRKQVDPEGLFAGDISPIRD